MQPVEASPFRRLMRIALLSAGLATIAPLPAWAGNADRWLALWAALPALPASADSALARVTAQGVSERLVVSVSDPSLLALQRDIDALFEPTAQASRNQIARAMADVESDPELARLAKTIDKTLGLNNPNAPPPSRAQLGALIQEATRVLGPEAMARDGAAAPTSDIAAYRLELRRATPRVADFHRRLFEQRQRYAALHAEADRAAPAGASPGDVAVRSLVERHHALAQQQLADARAIVAQARQAIEPRYQRMAALVGAAEARDAPPAERVQGDALLKAWLEALLSLQRDVLEDVGFWASIRAPSVAAGKRGLPYESALAPQVDLGVDAGPSAGLAYPSGRELRLARPPGIR